MDSADNQKLSEIFNEYLRALDGMLSPSGFIPQSGLLQDPDMVRKSIVLAFKEDWSRSGRNTPIQLYINAYTKTAWIVNLSDIEKTEEAFKKPDAATIRQAAKLIFEANEKLWSLRDEFLERAKSL